MEYLLNFLLQKWTLYFFWIISCSTAGQDCWWSRIPLFSRSGKNLEAKMALTLSSSFIRGLSCPALAVFRPQYLLSETNYNCLPVSSGDIGFLTKILGLLLAWKSGLKVLFLPLGRFCPQQTILLSDQVECDSPLQIVMAFWRTFIVSRGLSYHTQRVWIQTKRAPNCHYYLQRAVAPDWMGSIFLRLHIRAVSSRVGKPSDNINSYLFYK
jgi:hypothetical protein